jgi:hypothetical protein
VFRAHLAADLRRLVVFFVPRPLEDALGDDARGRCDLGDLAAQVVGLRAREYWVALDGGVQHARHQLLDLARGHQLRRQHVWQLRPGGAGTAAHEVHELVAPRARGVGRHHPCRHVLLRQLRRLTRLCELRLTYQVVLLRAEDLAEEARRFDPVVGVLAQLFDSHGDAIALRLAQADPGFLQQVGVTD